MAGGIDWFRWHHGTVKDQKFTLIARRSGGSVAEVVAVWACLLERASESDDRGNVGAPDFESMDCALGMADGRAAAIFAAMQAKNLIDEGARLTAWTDRQPKKEDNMAADRKRAQRERDAAAKAVTASDRQECHAASRDVTTEESRGEKSNTSSLRSEEPRKRVTPPPCPDDVDAQVWVDWLALRKAKKAPVTDTVIDGARREAIKADLSLESFLRIWCQRGSQGLQADWLKPAERAGPPQSRADRQLETAALLTGARRPQPKPLEAIDVESRILSA